MGKQTVAYHSVIKEKNHRIKKDTEELRLRFAKLSKPVWKGYILYDILEKTKLWRQ
jgi:hypothetical protein